MDTDSASGKPTKHVSPAGIIVRVVGACIILALLVSLFLPVIQTGSHRRRHPCTNNLYQIGIALQNYHDTYKSFPPAYLADENGQPMHSWRALILPFLGDQAQRLYDRYDFDEPWDGPNNRKLAAQPPSILVCPSSDDFAGQTNYLAVVDNETMWPGANVVATRNISDGTSRTLAVVETTGSGINWMEPRDISFEQAQRGINREENQPSICSNHPGGANVLLADGSVHFFPDDLSPESLRAFLTANGGEDAQLPW